MLLECREEGLAGSWTRGGEPRGEAGLGMRSGKSSLKWLETLTMADFPKYCAGQKFHLVFFCKPHRKTRMNFLVNTVFWQHPSLSRIWC